MSPATRAAPPACYSSSMRSLLRASTLPFALAVLLAAACFIAVAGCGPSGGAAPGDSCMPDNSGLCYSPYLAFECWQGKLREVQCRGRLGCSDNGSSCDLANPSCNNKPATTIYCDMTQNVPGDGCFHMYEGASQCSSDGMSAYKCIGGTIVDQGACAGCYSQGATVYCH